MTKSDISEIKKLLKTSKQIAIIPHKNPDGDAIGSTLGLYHYLNNHGHNPIVIAPNDYPEFLKWIPGEDTIIKHDAETEKANDLIQKAEIIFYIGF